MQVEMERPVGAPGCYAAPTVFSHDSEICQSCPAFDKCSQDCLKTLEVLRDKIDVTDILARHRATKKLMATTTTENEDKPASKFLPSIKVPESKVERKVREKKAKTTVELTPEMEKFIETSITQINAKNTARKWVQEGLIEHIRHELQAGRNPFPEQKRNHEVVCFEELLKGPVSRDQLAAEFRKLGKNGPWLESSVKSHINIVMPVLVAFGIAEVVGGNWVIKKGD